MNSFMQGIMNKNGGLTGNIGKLLENKESNR